MRNVLKKTSAKTWTGTRAAGNHGVITVEIRRENAGYYVYDADANRFMGACWDTLAEAKAWMVA